MSLQSNSLIVGQDTQEQLNDCDLSFLYLDWDDVSGADNMCYTLIGLAWPLQSVLMCQSLCYKEIGLHECVNHYDARR